MWRPLRILAFLGIGLLLYALLFVLSDRLLLAQSDRNPFYRAMTAAPATDWLILGASHAMPLGFAGMAGTLSERTGQDTLALAATGAGPFVQRLVAERYFDGHTAGAVLVVVDRFAFLDPRWNAGRMDDSDMLPKIPADRATAAVLLGAVSRGLPWQDAAAYVTGFARINDASRLSRDVWEAEARFDTAPRPSDAADKARIAYLYPGPADPAAEAAAMADLAATIDMARAQGARVVLVRPPLPDRFRARLPDEGGFDRGLADFAAAHGARLVDHAGLVPESRFYLDSDHLNRAGVGAWLDRGLAAVLTEE